MSILSKSAFAHRFHLWLRRVVQERRSRGFVPYIKHKSVEGLSFDFWIGDPDGQQWYDLAATDPVWVEMRIIREKLIRKGDVIFECGAHHGCTTIMLSKWVCEEGRIIAFEALPANCDIIAKNIELNKATNVSLERSAVGSAPGTLRISGLSNSEVTRKGSGISVRVVCLDEFVEACPTFLKIHVEGYEVEVLKGARKILSMRPKMAIEVHPEQLARHGSSVAELFELLDPRNYDWWIQWKDDSEPVLYDFAGGIEHRVHLFGLPR